MLNRRLPLAVAGLVTAPVARQDQSAVGASFAYRIDVIGCPGQRVRPHQVLVDGQMTAPTGTALAFQPCPASLVGAVGCSRRGGQLPGPAMVNFPIRSGRTTTWRTATLPAGPRIRTCGLLLRGHILGTLWLKRGQFQGITVDVISQLSAGSAQRPAPRNGFDSRQLHLKGRSVTAFLWASLQQQVGNQIPSLSMTAALRAKVFGQRFGDEQAKTWLVTNPRICTASSTTRAASSANFV